MNLSSLLSIARRDVVVAAPAGHSLQGHVWEPSEPAAIAVLVTHGAGASHLGRTTGWITREFARHGLTTLALNRRDHEDRDPRATFEQCIDDVRTGIAWLERQGYRRIFLCGHSKGTSLLPWYVVSSGDKRIAALGLFGPMESLPQFAREYLMVGTYEENVARAERLSADGAGDEPFVLELSIAQRASLSPNAFLSFFGPNSKAVPIEHVSALRIPTLLCGCSSDDVTPVRYLEALQRMARAGKAPVDSLLIRDSVCGRDGYDGHCFLGLEAETAGRVIAWLSRVLPESVPSPFGY
jgi:pimeloyl-ACP methyl ester carboxylesterase